MFWRMQSDEVINSCISIWEEDYTVVFVGHCSKPLLIKELLILQGLFHLVPLVLQASTLHFSVFINWLSTNTTKYVVLRFYLGNKSSKIH